MTVTHKGFNFTADVKRLEAVGRLDLPDLANTYATLNNAVAGTNQYDLKTFNPCPSDSDSSGGTDQVGGPWIKLRNLLQNFLGNGSKHFEDAGTGILDIANNYAKTDATTEADVTRAWKDGVPLEFQDKYGYSQQPPSPKPPDVVINPNPAENDPDL